MPDSDDVVECVSVMVEDPRSRKNAARERSRALLATADERTLAACSRQVAAHLTQWGQFDAATTIMVYLSIADSGEIDLAPLIAEAIDRGKCVCAPVIDWDSRTMRPAPLRSAETDVRIGRYGVPEPVSTDVLPLDQIQLVLVPGLAFDRAGNRLGRGAGFYDRFLQDIRESSPGVLVCGVCWSAQIEDELPTEPHDQHLDALASELAVIEF